MNTWKQELWDKSGIGVPHLDIEANDSVIFGYLVCWFITEVSGIIYWLFVLILGLVYTSLSSRTFVASNAIQTIDNKMSYAVLICLNCI